QTRGELFRDRHKRWLCGWRRHWRNWGCLPHLSLAREFNGREREADEGSKNYFFHSILFLRVLFGFTGKRIVLDLFGIRGYGKRDQVSKVLVCLLKTIFGIERHSFKFGAQLGDASIQGSQRKIDRFTLGLALLILKAREFGKQPLCFCIRGTISGLNSF